MYNITRLIAAGAEINTQDKNGYTALHFATKSGYIGIVKLLIKLGADVNSKKNIWSDTPLINAVLGGYAIIVKLLVANDADVNMRGIEQSTAFLIATENRQFYMMKLLKDFQANINIENKMGFSALIQAIFNRKPETVKVLKELGVDITMGLSLAKHEGYTEIVQILEST